MKTFLVTILLFISCFVFAQDKENDTLNKGSLVNGHYFKLLGSLTENVHLPIYLTFNHKKIIIRAVNQKFNFEGYLDEPTWAVIKINNPKYVCAFYLDTTTIHLSAKIIKTNQGFGLQKILVKGSPHQLLFEKYTDFINSKKSYSGLEDYNTALSSFLLKMIMNSPDFKFCAELIFSNADILGYQWTKQAYNTLSTRLKYSPLGLRVQMVLSRQELTSVGSILPNFSLAKEDGNLFLSTSLKEKIIFIDFWASWCLSCRKEIPKIREVYQMYSNRGVEFVAISLDDSKSKWLSAIKADNSPGIQLSDLKGKNSKVAKQFFITSIPFNILVDKEGKIVATNLSPEDLSKTLNIICKK